MILVDTSVWIDVLKDQSGEIVAAFHQVTLNEIIVFSRFIQLELLQGAKDNFEWRKLDEYLSTQYYLETKEDTWRDAGRIYFDLGKKGLTVRSPVDCCIAQVAIEANALLIHKDKDFEKIAQLAPLQHTFFQH